jgi:phage antirepressor YoqD-like protein
MKNLPSLNNGQTMSSREIAELTNKRHDHVLRDIKTQLYAGLYEVNFDSPNLGYQSIQGLTVVVDDYTKRTKEILLDRYHTDILVSGYDVKYRAAIVKRWHELELQAVNQQFNIPKTLPEALRLAADTQEKLEVTEQKLVVAENQIEQDKPKVEFAMAIKNTNGLSSIGELAKCLGIGEIRLFKKLRESGFLMRNNEPYQRYVDSGLFKYLPNKPYTDAKGKTHQHYQTYVTGRGMIYFEKKFREERPLRNGLVIITGDIFVNNSSSEVVPC